MKVRKRKRTRSRIKRKRGHKGVHPETAQKKR